MFPHAVEVHFDHSRQVHAFLEVQPLLRNCLVPWDGLSGVLVWMKVCHSFFSSCSFYGPVANAHHPAYLNVVLAQPRLVLTYD